MTVRFLVILLIAIQVGCGVAISAAQDRSAEGTGAVASPSLQIQSDGLDGFERIGTIAISPGGNLIATLRDGTIVLFDGKTGRRLRRWSVLAHYHDNNILDGGGSICFADNGEYLVHKPSRGNTATLFSTRDGRMMRRLEFTTTACLDGVGFYGITFGKSPSTAVVEFFGYQDRRIEISRIGDASGRVFAVEGGQRIGIKWETHEISSKDLATIGIYSLMDGKLHSEISGISSLSGEVSISQVAISADLGFLAHIEDKTDRVWLVDLASRRSVEVAPLRNFKTDHVLFLNEGKWIMAATRQRDWIIVERATMRIAGRGKDYRGTDATGRVIVVADFGNDSHAVLTIPALERQAKIAPSTAFIGNIAAHNSSLYLGSDTLLKQIPLSQNGADISIAVKNRTLLATDVVTGRVAFQNSEGHLVFQALDGSQQSTRMPAGEVPMLLEFAPGKALVVGAISEADAQRIDASRGDPSFLSRRRVLETIVHLVYIADGTGSFRRVMEVTGLPNAMHVAVDGNTLWIASRERVAGYRLSDFREVHALNDAKDVDAMVSAENGAVLITKHGDRRVTAWEVASGARVGEYIGPSRDIRSDASGAIYIASGRDVTRWRYRTESGGLQLPQDMRTISRRLDRYARQPEPDSEVEIGVPGAVSAQIVRVAGGICGLPKRFSRDSRYLLCGPSIEAPGKKDYVIVDAVTGSVIRRFEHWGITTALPSFTADGRSVLMQELRGQIATLDLLSGDRRLVMDISNLGSVDQGAQSADATRIALRVHRGEYVVHVLQRQGDTWSPLARIPVKSVHDSLAMSTDGTRVSDQCVTLNNDPNSASVRPEF